MLLSVFFNVDISLRKCVSWEDLRRLDLRASVHMGKLSCFFR